MAHDRENAQALMERSRVALGEVYRMAKWRTDDLAFILIDASDPDAAVTVRGKAAKEGDSTERLRAKLVARGVDLKEGHMPVIVQLANGRHVFSIPINE